MRKSFILVFCLMLLSACGSQVNNANTSNSQTVMTAYPPSMFEVTEDREIPVDIPPPYLCIGGWWYNFLDSAKGSRYDKETLEYLGNVISSEKFPKKDFSSNCFAIGTEIYRIDEFTLYAETIVDFSTILYSHIGRKERKVT